MHVISQGQCFYLGSMWVPKLCYHEVDGDYLHMHSFGSVACCYDPIFYLANAEVYD